jgi:NAD(P)-dependent dehydrogenase (short-subunit alcohol dehydrogenase family)
MDLINASVIVTGGAGGFGSATVRRLAQIPACAGMTQGERSSAGYRSRKA